MNLKKVFGNSLFKPLVLFIGVFLLLFIVSYMYSHGRASIKNQADWDYFSIADENDRIVKSAGKDGDMTFILSSGEYKLVTGKEHVKQTFYIKVGRWLATTNITPSENPSPAVSKAANNVKDLSITGRDGKVYSVDKGVPVDSFTIQTPIKEEPFFINSSKALAREVVFYDTALDKFVGVEYRTSRLVVLGAQDNQLDYVGNFVFKNPDRHFVVDDSDGSFIFFDEDKVYFVKSTSGQPRLIQSVNPEELSAGDDGPMVSFDNSILATYVGPVSGNFDAEDSSKPKELTNEKVTVRLFDLEKDTLLNELSSDTSSLLVPKLISFNSSSNWLLFQGLSGEVVVFGSSDIKNIVARFKLNSVGNLLWHKNSLVYVDPTEGLKLFDVTSRTGQLVFGNSLLRFKTVGQQGESFFVTADVKPPASEKPMAFDSQAKISPVLHKIDFSKNMTSSDRLILSNLPLVKNAYVVDFFGNRIFFVPTSGNINDPLFSNKDLLNKEINSRIDDAKSYLDSVGIDYSKVSFSKNLTQILNYGWSSR